MKGKIEKFLKTLYADLNEKYRVEREELEKIQNSIKAFESGELSDKEQAIYLAAQNMEIGRSAYCKRIKNALNSIELLSQPGASVPPIAENLLRQYYAACKDATKNEGRTDMDNVLSVQILRIESQLREVGYAIFGGLSTFKKIEKEKAERKLKKAQKALRRLEDPKTAGNNTDEMNSAAPQKMVGSNAQGGDAPAGDAKENTADPAQTGGTPAGAKEDTADSAAQVGDTPADAKENTADPAAQADPQEKSEEMSLEIWVYVISRD